ncbi:MAG: hypothetical protein Q8K75_00990, partial [Chlamydiales bacterium]|nr:hypothetical protein [Chlamydiales bacterium]
PLTAMKRLYHFIGGIYFAIILIATTTAFVIAGTFLESFADSHKFAAAFTYSSPLFTLLLCGFFVNILVSSLRRWPFKPRHIPFLITHLGLLMLLSGAIGKIFFGVQGTLRVVEGSGSHRILLPDTHAVEITSPEATTYWLASLNDSCKVGDTEIQCITWRPNSRERLEFWIKGSQAYINGLPPFPVVDWTPGQELAPTITARTETAENWEFAAYRTHDLPALAKATYAADGPIDFSPVTGFGKVSNGRPREPSLILVEDTFGDNHLWAYYADGRIASEVFRRESIESLIAYGDGYKGYAIESALLPSLECPITRSHTAQAPCNKLEDNLPLIVLKAFDEEIPLTFDRFAIGMRWPILKGKYLVRFQPMSSDIPYHIRLHTAKQTNYPGGSQPYRYEAMITVTDRRDSTITETTLSMNKVHETWDGYRFYLSNIAPGNEGALHQVQIVVNHDPVKYWLTYPGAIFMSLGVILLFLFNRARWT